MAVSSTPPKAFVWGANGAALTPEEIEKQKALEAAIVARGVDTSPVDHWTQGAARVADALAGAFRRGRLDSAAKESSALGESAFSDAMKAFGGGTSAAGQAAATAPYTTATAGTQTADVGDLSGNDVYSGFMDTVKAGGVQNPYALAAIAATGKAESGFDPGNVNRTWSDPSQSGKPGRAGGIMSWRGPRYEALALTGDLTPQGQAKFFLQEDPKLIASLNNAKSVEEAQGLMNRAWAFAGYDQPGGETARRMQLAASFAPQFQSQGVPAEVASLDPSAGMAQLQTAVQAIEAQAPTEGTSLSDEAAAFRATPEYAAQFPGQQAQPLAPQAAPSAPVAQAPIEVAGGGGRPSEAFNPYANEAIVKAMSSPHLSAGQRAVMQAMLQQQQAQQQAAREEQTWMRRQQYEQQIRANDPANALDMDYKRAQLEALKAKPQEPWQKLDDDTLFRPSTGETRELSTAGPDGAKPFRYGGNSVEAQSLNGLIDSGQLTPGQAQQLGAGKTITGPNGEIIFMTPQGVFSQSGNSAAGQSVPVAPQSTPATTPAPQPAQPRAPAPQSTGMIPLTAPKDNTQLPAEMGARIGMGDAFLQQLPSIRERISSGNASGLIDGAKLQLGIGEPASLWRDIETGRDALVRNLTGAGMSESEARNQTARYQISPIDSADTMLEKLGNLERDLRATRAGAIGARTGKLGTAPSAGANDPLAAARQAIAKGAPRAAVIERLRQSGINPEGL